MVPWRSASDGGIEVYWVRRSPTLKFMGGWHAFPGGGLSSKDAEVPLADRPRGASETTFSPASPEVESEPAPDLVGGLAVCAIRELFEETGLLLLDQGSSDDATSPSPASLATARGDLLSGKSFARLVEEQGWTLSSRRLTFAGRWLTPPFSPLRFDNRFFLLQWERDRAIQPGLMGTELDRGEWIRPRDAIARWRRGAALIAPPILHLLRVLDQDGPETGLDRLRQPAEANVGPFRRIEFRPGVVLLPLRTPTLPPATHTNAYLLGYDRAVLVDPATPHPDECDRLLRALTAAADQGRKVSAIWLTHHHPDHVGAADAVRRHLGVPIAAHPITAQRLRERGLPVDEELRDGEVVDLGGGTPFPVRVVHTPGHAAGHLCFFCEADGSLIAGDLASTLSTIVIDPPDGDMDAYLASLDRVIALEPKMLFPAHGPAVLQAVATLDELKRHRLEREEQIHALWHAGTRDVAALVKSIYAELPARIHPVAERQLQAHLERLAKLGKLAGS